MLHVMLITVSSVILCGKASQEPAVRTHVPVAEHCCSGGCIGEVGIAWSSLNRRCKACLF